MAENFPYFKFVASEWLTGDIVFEDFDVQGLFINICAVYWQRNGDLTIDDIKKRYKNPPQLAALTNGFISVTDGEISIKFLDEQLIAANHISKVNSENGAKGGRPKKTDQNRPLSELNRPLSEKKQIRIRIKEEEEINKRKEENTGEISPSGGAFWNLYEKMLGIFSIHFVGHFRDDAKDEPACNLIARNIEKVKGWDRGACMNGKMAEFLDYWGLMAEKASKHSWLGQQSLKDLSDREWQKWCVHMSNQEKGISSKDKKKKEEKQEHRTINLQELAKRYE